MCEVLDTGWGNQSGNNRVGDSTTVVLNLAFAVLGAKGVGRNHSHTLCSITGLCKDLLLPWCSGGQFLALMLLTATAGAEFTHIFHSPAADPQPEPRLCRLRVGGGNLSSL